MGTGPTQVSLAFTLPPFCKVLFFGVNLLRVYHRQTQVTTQQHHNQGPELCTPVQTRITTPRNRIIIS